MVKRFGSQLFETHVQENREGSSLRSRVQGFWGLWEGKHMRLGAAADQVSSAQSSAAIDGVRLELPVSTESPRLDSIFFVEWLEPPKPKKKSRYVERQLRKMGR